MIDLKRDREALRVMLFAALASIAVAVWAHQLWAVEDWRTPLNWYQGGDAMFNVLLAQNIEETGWYQENPRLGAPDGLELYDWPGAILVPMVLFRLLGLGLDSPGAIVNAYYLLGWPLAAMVAAWALLRFGIRPPLAAAFGVLFSAIPAHGLRGEPHLFLATLALVPPVLVVAHELARDGLTRRGRILALAFAVVLGASDAYYGFFASFLVLAAAGIGWFTLGGVRRLLDAAAFGVCTAAGLAVAILPTLLYGDTTVVARTAVDTGLLGLKLGQLLMPVVGHRFHPFAVLSEKYILAGSAPGLASESVASAMGLLASLGLLLLLATLLGARLSVARPESLTTFARLSLAAVLFATVGGFGSVFVTFVSAQIRAYNRISVFLAFLALAALAMVLDGLLERWPVARRQPLAAWTVALALTLLGAFDQNSRLAIPNHRANAAEWKLDGDWVSRTEALLPAGAMVFQLPWVPFPESPPVQRLFNYDSLRPILRSHSLRWSHGAMKQSKSDLLHRSLVDLPAQAMTERLRAEGFAAIALDRWGYEGNGDRLAAELAGLLGPPAVESTNQRWLLFVLSPLAQSATMSGTS